MAELANAEMWHDLPSGPAHAQEAVRLARACRSAKALAYALAAKVMAGVFTDGSGDIRDAEEAQAAAAQAHDVRAFMVATVWAGNCLDCSASRAVLERWQSGREKLVSMGAPHVYIAWLSANEAVGLLQLGDWRGCEERLRNVLGSTPGPQRAAQACADAHLVWDEAYTWWRATEALAKDRTARDAAAALRRAHELAVDLQAAPLLADVEALAQSTRISLATVDEAPPAETATLPGITPREREILAHIVAGRTYGEIARELVLSEKTVSVHVSHLLHKTGAANRVELAQLARRVASSGPADL